MRIFVFLVAVYTAFIVFGVVSARAADEDPVARQISPFWDITGITGTQTVGQNPESCAMETAFDNGFHLVFKAKGERLTALRVLSTDQSNRILKIKGFVGLGIGKNSYAVQSRFDNGQIDASLLTVPHLADKMMDATVLRLKLGVKNYYFAIQGFAEGYQNLMVCMGLRPTKTLKVVDESRPQPSQFAPVTTGNTVISPRPPLADMPAEPVVDVNVEDLQIAAADQPLPMPAAEPVITMADEKDGDTTLVVDEPATEIVAPELSQWTATKGEKLSAVLAKWGEQAGVKTHMALDTDPVLKKDIAVNGSFAVAVNALLNETGTSGGRGASALVRNDQGRVTHIAGYRGGIGARQQAAEAVDGYERWRALEGTDLRKVLLRWSNKMGVDFYWESPETYLLPRSLKTTEDFDKAVALLLAQFEGQSVRPVAQLNIDPQTGKKALIVKTHREEG